MRLGHHSNQLHHMFCAENLSCAENMFCAENIARIVNVGQCHHSLSSDTLLKKKIKKAITLPTSLHCGRLSKELNTVFELRIIMQRLHSTLCDRSFLKYEISVKKDSNIKSPHLSGIFEGSLVDCSKTAFSQFLPYVHILSFDLPIIL